MKPGGLLRGGRRAPPPGHFSFFQGGGGRGPPQGIFLGGERRVLRLPSRDFFFFFQRRGGPPHCTFQKGERRGDPSPPHGAFSIIDYTLGPQILNYPYTGLMSLIRPLSTPQCL